MIRILGWILLIYLLYTLFRSFIEGAGKKTKKVTGKDEKAANSNSKGGEYIDYKEIE